MIKIFIAVLITAFINGPAEAQDSTTTSGPDTSILSYSGYVEAYYTYDFNQPYDNTRPGVFYSHNRHNEWNLNLGFIKATYLTKTVRGNLAIGAGTYMNANYASEPGVIKHIFEANAGFKLGNNLWLDAGILPSHIGFESATGKDNWTVTRSMAADNTPYYEAGAKLTYASRNSKWLISCMALNGWQRIQRIHGNSLMSFGTQLTYKPLKKVTLNYSTFLGTDKPDTVRQLRHFHNLYGIFTISRSFGLTAGFDIGAEEKSGSGMNIWYAPILIAKYAFTGKFSLSGRVEYYSDENGVIISTSTPNGFKTTGFSLNLDYAPALGMLVRVEGRRLHSKDAIFEKGSALKNNNSFLTGVLALAF